MRKTLFNKIIKAVKLMIQIGCSNEEIKSFLINRGINISTEQVRELTLVFSEANDFQLEREGEKNDTTNL